ncbi:hypothetical protein [Pseudodesulfovibrio sp. zrk46]|uniref:hypothetical protein n=1 Tax=Pseudodesulfovibrio sp. zrk46 TaxID=2725288 RepID=UPI00144929BC|nr:hypothetical protein [Pseudodesulfovibrio sp. zrk46]QJB55181.1 hypothetical protein HFN16_01635 [Pseudodesulfovibrio sp. zrk46]
MKKLLVMCLLVSILFMMGFLKFERGFRNGYYYSETRPNITLKIDKSLRYLGETDVLQGRLKSHAYMWLTPIPDGPGLEKMFIVEHSTVSQELANFTTAHLFRGMPSFANGRMDIGGESYQYVFYITEPRGKNFWTDFITVKGFVLNKPKLTACFGKISTDTAWTKFYYMASFDDTKYFKGELTDADRALMNQFLENFRNDIQYRGKYKK